MDTAKIKFYLNLGQMALFGGSIAAMFLTIATADAFTGRMVTITFLMFINAYLILKYNEVYDELARKWGWRK